VEFSLIRFLSTAQNVKKKLHPEIWFHLSDIIVTKNDTGAILDNVGFQIRSVCSPENRHALFFPDIDTAMYWKSDVETLIKV
jgi:hypothetical protein